MSKYIGVDLGTTKCGLSIGNDITYTASPLTTLYLDDLSVILEHFQQLSKEYGVSRFVLGDPLKDHQHKHPLESSIAVIKELYVNESTRWAFDIVWWDESYTSQLSTARAKEYPKHSRDAHAATMILQSYLDSLKG